MVENTEEEKVATKVVKMNLSENNYVVKSNKFLELKRNIEFSVLEEKLLLALISEIRLEDEDFCEYDFKIKDFLELTNIDNRGKVYKDIHNAARTLAGTLIDLEEDGNPVAITFLSYAKTIKNKGIIKLRFEPTLKPYLLSLQKKFTRYQLKNILKLKANYSIRLYELLKQNLVMRYRVFEIEDLKELLGIPGKYEKVYDFKKNVIEKALEEINEYTNISVTYDQEKTGRRVTHFRFKIKPQFEDDEAKIIEKLYTKDQIEDLKEKCGLTDKKVSGKQLFELYNLAVEKTDHLDDVDVYQYFRLNLAYTEEKNPKNFIAYLKKALKDDYSNAVIILKYKDKI